MAGEDLYNPQKITEMRAARRVAMKKRGGESKARSRTLGLASKQQVNINKMQAGLEAATPDPIEESPKQKINSWLESLDSAREESIAKLDKLKNSSTSRESNIQIVNEREPFPEKDYPVSTKKESTDSLVLTPRQAELLERVVWAEAGNQGVKGRNAVRGVILNRIASNRFPNTLEEVLTQSGQFEPVGKAGGDLYAIKAPAARLDQQYFELLDYLEKGKDASQGSTFFLNKATSKKRGTDFSGANPLQIGAHTFYSSYKGQEPVVVPDTSHNVVVKRKVSNV